MARDRLQKILAQAGIASRRAAEELIVAGRVRVNGKVVRELGSKADAGRDQITVDGRPIHVERHAYYLLNKPRGVVTTLHDPEGRPTIRELLRGVTERVFPVGRLDYSTAGVLLCTNDGELANAVLHPSRTVERTYAVKLRGSVRPETVEKWRRGVTLEDGVTAPAKVSVLEETENATWLRVTIHEGRNRQIHRMGEATGHPVQRLTRLEFAGLTAEGLAPGEFRELTQKELTRLKRDHGAPQVLRKAGAEPPSRPPARPARPRGPRPEATRRTGGGGAGRRGRPGG
ncbi:MAG: rRNA pseudouridine synthase [Deltaproteobacteria bacterium]|nr:rRNA pseudouridine synthase [Deltaproteobacteria bacterium]